MQNVCVHRYIHKAYKTTIEKRTGIQYWLLFAFTPRSDFYMYAYMHMRIHTYRYMCVNNGPFVTRPLTVDFTEKCKRKMVRGKFYCCYRNLSYSSKKKHMRSVYRGYAKQRERKKNLILSLLWRTEFHLYAIQLYIALHNRLQLYHSSKKRQPVCESMYSYKIIRTHTFFFKKRTFEFRVHLRLNCGKWMTYFSVS